MEVCVTEPVNAFELQGATDKLKLYESADNDIIQADLVQSQYQIVRSKNQYISKQMRWIKYTSWQVLDSYMFSTGVPFSRNPSVSCWICIPLF